MQEENRSLIDKTFGGTKRTIIVLLTLSIIIAFLTGREVPDQIYDALYSILMIYFGASGVKLGMDIKNKQ